MNAGNKYNENTSNGLAACAKIASIDSKRDAQHEAWLAVLHGLTIMVSGIRKSLQLESHCKKCGKVL